MKFPFTCCRCGVCCLAEICVIGQSEYGVGKYDLCPGLSYVEGSAVCALAGIVPVGDGCCIKASAYKDGVGVDFASLPSNVKRSQGWYMYKQRKGVVKVTWAAV